MAQFAGIHQATALKSGAPDAWRPPTADTHRVEEAIQARISAAVRVIWHNNTRTMVSARRVMGGVQLRLHHMFAQADEAALDAVAAAIYRTRRGVPQVALNQFIQAHASLIATRRTRTTVCQAQGSCHDLQAYLDALREHYFDGELEVRVTWSRKRSYRRRPRSIRLGSYHPDQQLIRIHPVLDSASVPAFFVSYVLYHEALHHVIPPEVRPHGTVFHSAAFRERERQYEAYDAAIAWEKLHIRRLLRECSSRGYQRSA